MADGLTLEQEQYFQSICDAANAQGTDMISNWEKGFMDDQMARFEEYGSETRFSHKQWNIVMKVGDKYDIERVEL